MLVLDDVPCEGCGYVLRGLTVDARCPECNAPVAESLHDDRLVEIPRRRLERLRRGMRIAELGLFAVMAGLLSQVTISPLAGILRPHLSATVMTLAARGLRLGGFVLLIGGVASVVTAAILLSNLGPRDASRPDQVRLARTIRGGLLAGGLLIGLGIALPMIGVGGGPGSTMGATIQLGAAAGLIALGEAWRGLLLRIAWLDDRSGEADGKADLRGLGRGVRAVAIALAAIFGGRVVLLAIGGGPGWLPNAMTGVGVLLSFALIPMLLGTVGGSVQLRRRIDLLLIARREREAIARAGD